MHLLILPTASGPVMVIAALIVTPTGRTTVEARYEIRRAWRIRGDGWLWAKL